MKTLAEKNKEYTPRAPQDGHLVDSLGFLAKPPTKVVNLTFWKGREPHHAQITRAHEGL